MKTEGKTKTSEVEWWALQPDIPKEEPTLGRIEFKSRKAAKLFAEVLVQVVAAAWQEDSRPALQCVQMQTVEGLRLVTADGFRLAVAEYRPGLRDAENKGSNILARPALFSVEGVRAVAKVLKGASPKGWAKIEVKRDGKERTLSAFNDKGEHAHFSEQAGSFPDWKKLPPTEKAAAPAALNATYLQWVGRFCKAITCNGDGIVRISHLAHDKPARFDAESDAYRGIAVVMPMWVTVE